MIQKADYKILIEKQINEIISYLTNNNIEFSIVANITNIEFNPNLPSDVKSTLNKFSLFELKNYTYSTIVSNKEYLSFETGFGKDNFGSVLRIPNYSILQIILEDSILYLNPLATIENFRDNLKNNSLNAFKNNPNNNKFKLDM